MNEQFEVLDHEDVIVVEPDTFEDLDITRASKVAHLLEAIQECFGSDTKLAALFSPEGIDCETLRVGAKGWQQGKLRINLEFCSGGFSVSPPLNGVISQIKQAQS